MITTLYTDMMPINPVKPVAPYIGGKSRLAKTIIPYIDSIPHKTYCEPFVGMGGIFLRRSFRPRTEVINDYNGEVVNLFRILNQHYTAFLDMIKWQLATRREFNRLVNTRPDTLTDLQRAARFLYLQRLAFGGKVSGRTFGIDAEGSSYFNLQKLVPMLEDVHERLSHVIIENLDYKECIRRFDRQGTLFYLDPPYYGNEQDYGQSLFSREEFSQMATLLKDIKGKFILSLNNHPEVVKMFSAFYQQEVSTTYSASKSDPKRIRELLISNVRLETKGSGNDLLSVLP